MTPFQIGRQQTKYTIGLRIAIEEGKGIEKTLTIYGEIFNEMPAYGYSGSATALEDGLFAEIARSYPLILEKGYREKWDLPKGSHFPGLNAKQLTVIPV